MALSRRSERNGLSGKAAASSSTPACQYSFSELVTITETVAACRDPSDDKFLELAVNGRADLIVTGDIDLLVLDPLRDIPIITARAFGHIHARVT